MRQLIAGNWKMNGTSADLAEIETLARAFAARAPRADTLICPPAPLIGRAVAAGGRHVPIGGQDCHPEKSGAFTGDISAEMLADAGAVAVIVGHSERRHYHGETSEEVAAKARAAWRAGLAAIVCIGETDTQRRDGIARDICGAQIEASVPAGAGAANLAVAYEPVWAIGTGKTPSLPEIAEMHAHVRACLVTLLGEEGHAIRILYGGSVKPSNAGGILALEEVGGALIGGASLKAADYLAIVATARAGA